MLPRACCSSLVTQMICVTKRGVILEVDIKRLKNSFLCSLTSKGISQNAPSKLKESHFRSARQKSDCVQLATREVTWESESGKFPFKEQLDSDWLDKYLS